MTTTPNDAAVNAELGTWFVVVQFNTRDNADEFIEDHLQDEPFTVEYEPSNIERHAAKPVNAESAAKLVKSLRDTLARWSTDRAGIDDAPGSSYWAQGYNECLKQHRQTIKEILTRHATPQTQATHGEGEAVRFVIEHDVIHDRVTGKHVRSDDSMYPHEDGIIACCKLLNELAGTPSMKLLFSNDWARERIAADPDVDVSAGDGSSQSSTAAPALGELAKKLLQQVSDAQFTSFVGVWIANSCELMEQAAAALSGVAAQGDAKP